MKRWRKVKKRRTTGPFLKDSKAMMRMKMGWARNNSNKKGLKKWKRGW